MANDTIGTNDTGAKSLTETVERGDAATERAAIPADHWAADRPTPDPREPDNALVERLARALAVPRPWQRPNDLDRALDYFRAAADGRLDGLDALARGLLVTAAEAEAQRYGGQAQ
jgi:hypothetical protein